MPPARAPSVFGRLKLTAPPLWLAVVLPLGSFTAAVVSLSLFGPNTPLWISNAFVVTALLRNRRSTWPALLCLGALADYAANFVIVEGMSIVGMGILVRQYGDPARRDALGFHLGHVPRRKHLAHGAACSGLPARAGGQCRGRRLAAQPRLRRAFRRRLGELVPRHRLRPADGHAAPAQLDRSEAPDRRLAPRRTPDARALRTRRGRRLSRLP